MRSVENAKRASDTPRHINWVIAKDKPHNPEEFDLSPDQLQKKRKRWLQFHDQQTAGLPGLLPLYLGMRVRVTEKLSKKLNILKHTPCTVVGWDLHAADRVETRDGERVLQDLPLCIYLKFEGATWQLHKDLQVGVFPLKPTTRTWMVDRQKETKAERRGFQLVPDYACTAHMVQGMTLDALLADCGDVLDISLLKDMLAAYVAMSRVRSADGLLLVRAFSKMLFQQGPPPGPHVLMKLLRARLVVQNDDYTSKEAVEEYDRLAEEKAKAKALRKEVGLVWKCSACAHAYPAAGFGAEASKTAEVYASCVKPGAWLACSACAETFRISKEDPVSTAQTNSCSHCCEVKSLAHFPREPEGCTWCRQCRLQRGLEFEICKGCRKRKRVLEFPDDHAESPSGDGTLTAYCLACVSKATRLDCTVCRSNKPRFDFGKASIVNFKRDGVLRCKLCWMCSKCGDTKDRQGFRGNSASCKACEDIVCDICGLACPKHMFRVQAEKGKRRYNRCSACRVCSQCFELREYQEFSAGKQICNRCSEWTCVACSKAKPEEVFDKLVLNNACGYGRALVRLACGLKGCSP